MMMTAAERFLATMRYQQPDRCPIYDFNFWDETLPHWHSQGLPAWVNRTNSEDYFGTDLSLGSGSRLDRLTHVGANTQLCPGFEQRVIEDRGDHEVVMQSNGVIVLRRKFMGSIPMHLGHTLVDRASWNEHYKPRLDPSNPQRFPADFEARVRCTLDLRRPCISIAPAGSLYGWIRDWMGVEAVSLTVYDDPAWFKEMVSTVADCIYGVLEKVLAVGARFKAASFWEDMCFNSGPLLSPAHFKQYLSPHYRRLTGLLRCHGVEVIWVDCDGRIDELAPLWLETGVNTMFPIEVGTWGATPGSSAQSSGATCC